TSRSRTLARRVQLALTFDLALVGDGTLALRWLARVERLARLRLRRHLFRQRRQPAPPPPASPARARARPHPAAGALQKAVPVDRSVHRVHLDAAGKCALRLLGHRWSLAAESVVRDVARGLGCRAWFRERVRDCRWASEDAEAQLGVLQARQVRLRLDAQR